MRTLIIIAFVLALAVPGSAQHCVTWSTSEDAIPVGAHYVVARPPCSPECIYDIWIYEEANDIPGLQRADEIRDDTCHGQILGDKVIL